MMWFRHHGFWRPKGIEPIEEPTTPNEDDPDAREEYDNEYKFEGCICSHDPGQHGWYGCAILDCHCVGRWIE